MIDQIRIAIIDEAGGENRWRMPMRFIDLPQQQTIGVGGDRSGIELRRISRRSRG